MESEWIRTANIAPPEIQIAEIDADKEVRIRQEFHIRGYPTMLLMKDGFSFFLLFK